MIAKAEETASSADTVKLWAAGALLLAGLVLFYVFAEQSLLFRTLGLLAVMAVCLFLVYQTARGKNTVAFFRDARTEVRKVVWPSMLFRYVTTGAF